MISEKLQNVCYFLTSLAGEVPEEVWAKLRMARNELRDAAEQAELLEQGLAVPAGPIAQAKQQLQEVTHG